MGAGVIASAEVASAKAKPAIAIHLIILVLRLLQSVFFNYGLAGSVSSGELIAAFIKRAGGSVKGKISTGTVPEGLKPIYVHRQSRPLSKILAELLSASNNYIANQIFPEIGGASPGRASQPREVAQGRERDARRA